MTWDWGLFYAVRCSALAASNISKSSLSPVLYWAVSCQVSNSHFRVLDISVLNGLWWNAVFCPLQLDFPLAVTRWAVSSEQWCRRYSALIISLINTEFQGFVAGLEPPGLVWGYRVPGAPCSLLLLNDVLLDETWLINITTRLHRINSSYRASSKMAFIGLLNTRTFRQISDF